MNRKLFAVAICFLSASSLFAQEEKNKFSTKFYGFVRGDYAYDTRQSVAPNEGLFFLYPKDKLLDANGEDLNAVSNSGFYAFNSRAGVDVTGTMWEAGMLAKIEADFAGFSGANANSTVLRVRRAFMKMSWEKTSLLVGQEWHPMFLNVIPDVISLAAGAPFNVFNRSPQIRLDYKLKDFTLTGTALYQLQNTSAGPEGKSNNYQRTANVPELYLGVDYKKENFLAGIFVDYLTLKPRTQSSVSGTSSETLTYKVDETLGSFSYGAYAGYTHQLLSISAKTILGQNLSDMCMLGGYGITKRDQVTGKQEYTNFKHSSSWVNASYGKKYKGNLFAGYTKNLGSDKALIENSYVYGEGLGINSLYRLVGTFSYNISKFSIGLEYELTSADYGDSGSYNWSKGTYDKTHGVTNHRVVGVACYTF